MLWRSIAVWVIQWPQTWLILFLLTCWGPKEKSCSIKRASKISFMFQLYHVLSQNCWKDLQYFPRGTIKISWKMPTRSFDWMILARGVLLFGPKDLKETMKKIAAKLDCPVLSRINFYKFFNLFKHLNRQASTFYHRNLSKICVARFTVASKLIFQLWTPF